VVEEKRRNARKGASRPRTFRGVTTVVLKHFNTCARVADFGAKISQPPWSAAWVADMNLP
jgi:pantothenate synthetase